MQIRRTHQTLAAVANASQGSPEWEHQPGARVMTVDGPGRVTAVHDGPFRGSESYEIALEGGRGGGSYTPGQIMASLSPQAVSTASTEHLASEDYPELGTLLYDRPDPASLTYTASGTPPGWEGAQGPFPDEYGLPHVYARDVHSGAGNCVCGAGLHDGLHLQAAPGVELTHTADLVGQGDPGQSMTPGATASDEGNDNGSWPPEWNHALYHRKDDIPHVVAGAVSEEYEALGWALAHTWREEPLEEDEVRDHLIQHHGEDQDYLPWGLDDFHQRLHDEADEEGFPETAEEHEHHSMRPYGDPLMDHSSRGRPGGSTQPERERIEKAPIDAGEFPQERYRNFSLSSIPSSLPTVEAITDDRRKELRDQAADPAHYRELLRKEIAEEREHNRRTDEFLEDTFGPEMPTPRGYHPAWGGSTPQDDLFGRMVGTEPGVSQDVEDAREDRQSLHSLNHLTTGPAPEDNQALGDHLVNQHGYTNDQLAALQDPGQNDAFALVHEGEHGGMADEGVAGEFGAGQNPLSVIPHDHKGTSVHTRFPASTQWNHYGPPQGHYLSHLLVTSAMDEDFRFHVTASWADVRAKAKRIRADGKVNITHADDILIVANVQGDHHTYETGLQRYPGRRTSVASYSCGCKWGAYHWGASDDLSRFAGRMCSHALALQYEAASRGMFGQDVDADHQKAQWVPSKVVVKYDIDGDENIFAKAAAKPVPEQAPWLVALASIDERELPAVLAATNEMFGGGMAEQDAGHTPIVGPTVPKDPTANPASTGFLSAPDPGNWGSITNNMLQRYSILDMVTAYWDGIQPDVPPPAVKLADDTFTHPDQGAHATLHAEPEPALPETDGHVASLGDVDIAQADPATQDMEPEYQEIQSTGGMGDADLMPGSGIGGSEGTDPEDLGEDDSLEDAVTRTSARTEYVGDTADVVADFQKSAAAKALMSGSGKPSGGSGGDLDYVAAAEAYLAKQGAQFSAAERSALIEESPGVQAANTDRLDIEGTHYAELADDDHDDEGWLA